MKAEYLAALEKQSEWLRWSQGPDGVATWGALFRVGADASRLRRPAGARPQEKVQYDEALRYGDLYFVADHFCNMVEHARMSTPGDMRFEAEWLQSDYGFVWLQELLTLPKVEEQFIKSRAYEMKERSFTEEQLRKMSTFRLALRAFGWRQVGPDERILRSQMGPLGWGSEVAGPGTFQFLMYQARETPVVNDDRTVDHQNDVGFWPLSYFALRDGDILSERIAAFEQLPENMSGYTGRYHEQTNMWRHEIQLVFTLLRLMSQRITVQTHWPIDRAARRRAEAAGRTPPEHVRVITLRRFEERAKADPNHEPAEVDWQWQWDVRGHWRNQFYPSEGIHKPKWIDDYVKGPPDRPFKADQRRLFVATR